MSSFTQRLWYLFIVFSCVSCRIHKLILKDDERRYIDLTTFGFYEGGILEVKMINFKLPSGPVTGQYGFTLDRTINDAVSPYLEAHSDRCFLKENASILGSPQHQAFILFLRMDFNNLRLNISCSDTNSALRFYPNQTAISINKTNRQSQYILVNRKKRAPESDDDKQMFQQCSPPLHITKKTSQGYDYYNATFAMYVAWKKDEGLYNLYFHNCPDPKSKTVPAVNLMMEIYESNNGNFLSAGEMPLPALYSMMSLIFFLSAGFWTFILKTSRHTVYRIHIIMCVLVYLKALSLAFHGINYHFIQTKGEHVTAWAILFYITHLLKGAVLFVTIVLVGTGWNFIKHILTDRDKKLFMIVIPLQVVANVAEIIISESEEGALGHTVWRYIFILVDMLCCCAIFFPVVWSIRHLEDASSTDGKAAINLEKLKLFRHFYIMVVCYIYFTRFVISLLKVVVSFQYVWIDEMFRELATFVFFVMTGYKFRPAAANPYFTPNVEDDVDPQVLSEIGILDGVTKVKRGSLKRSPDTQPLMQEKYYDSD